MSPTALVEAGMPVNEERTVRTSVIIPVEVHQRVKALAAANDVSAAWVIRHILTAFLEQQGDGPKLPLKLAHAPKIEKRIS
jgi:hypothetical protein